MADARTDPLDALADLAAVRAAPTQTDELPPRTRRYIEPVRMNLNMAALIDVIFQLQVYFLLTAAFVLGEGVITANLPVGTGGAPEVDPLNRPINVIVSPAGLTAARVSLDVLPQAPANFTELAQMLERLRVPNGPFPEDTPVFIKPQPTVRWQHVVNAFNAAVAARYRNVAFTPAEKQNP